MEALAWHELKGAAFDYDEYHTYDEVGGHIFVGVAFNYIGLYQAKFVDSLNNSALYILRLYQKSTTW